MARAQDRIDSFMDQWREQRESADPAAWEPTTLAASPRPDDEIALLWLLRFRQGDRLVPRLVRYVDERRAQQDRWTQGLTGFAGPMTVLWGEQDPSAVVAMARHLGAIRPATEVITWPDVAHFPHYEVPQRVADHILDRVAPAAVTTPFRARGA